eukprot:7028161-Ditylum_brightwellii.AAC.1
MAVPVILLPAVGVPLTPCPQPEIVPPDVVVLGVCVAAAGAGAKVIPMVAGMLELVAVDAGIPPNAPGCEDVPKKGGNVGSG